MKTIKVGKKKIGTGEPIFIIAEIGINHDGRLKQAKKLVDAAVHAECSAAKFQTFTANALYVPQAGNYKLNGKDIPIYELHEKLMMPEDWIGELADYCKQHDIIFFSTPVDPTCVDLIDKYVPLYKVSSYDMTNMPLIKHLNSKKKPVVFSCGAANMIDVAETAAALKVPYAIMHCVAKYPAPLRYANLNVMRTLRAAFQVPVGFSSNGFSFGDGTIDTEHVPKQAAMLGADVFETHITLDRNMEGVDHFFAIEPNELRRMVRDMQNIRNTLDYYHEDEDIDPLTSGSYERKPYDIEEYVRSFCYKCLFAKKSINIGERFSADNVAVLRPGQYPKRGLEPKYYELVTTKGTARKAVKQWEPINWDDLL